MLHRLKEQDERLASLPVYKELLRVYTTHEIIQCVPLVFLFCWGWLGQ